MFTNGGFETGDFTGWTVGGNAVSGVATAGTPITGTLIPDNVVGVRTGDFAAFAKFQNTPTPTTLTLEQTIDVDPGVNYVITVRRGVFGTGEYRWTPSLKLTWVDTGAAGTSTGGWYVGPMWADLNVSGWVFPASRPTATFRFEFGGYATDTGGLAGFSIDDITIQPVPEPAGLAVTCVTAIGLLRRRRPCLS